MSLAKIVLRPALARLFAALFVASFSAVAFGSTVTVNYSTSGQFASGAGCNTAACSKGTGSNKITLTYTPTSGASVDVSTFGLGNGSNAQFGTFAISGTNKTLQSLNGDIFDLTITQVAPPVVPSSGLITGTLKGSISATASTLKITFSGPISLGTPADYVYTVFTPLTINAKSSGPTTVQGEIDVLTPPVPEPSSMLLLGSGLTGLASILRRRRKVPAAS